MTSSQMKPRCWEHSRKLRVNRGCSASAPATTAAKLSMTRYLGMPPKKAHAASKPTMTSSSFWLKVGQTKLCLQWASITTTVGMIV